MNINAFLFDQTLQAQAEEGYISACQLLSGYGQETFIARDHSRQHEVMIAISLTGIMVATENSETPKFYRYNYNFLSFSKIIISNTFIV